MKKFLILQLRPEDETSDNEYAAILRRGHLEPEETDRVRIEKDGLRLLDIDRYAAIIVGGSPFDISTADNKKSALQKKIEADFTKLFTELLKKDFPFLGACSGSGLLGNHCGATISNKFGEAVGGVDMALTEAGKKDPLLAGLPETFRVLVGHKEACDGVPSGATLLGSSSTCPVQMFRIGQNIYATQFHPEADSEVFKVRIAVYKHFGYFPPETAEELNARVEKEDTPHAHEILRRFVSRYRA